MNWKFEKNEISNGSYSLKGIRSTGNEVSLQAAENELARIFQDVYTFEISMGTLPSRAFVLLGR
jgi:hypothetical protein|tara:strand:- start:917 stop:1108 length:192 start_codon:yes stop_codon:yes gene_type:complete